MASPIDLDLERGYNIRQLYADFDSMIAALAERSAQVRKNADVSLDLSYDSGERDRLDLFRCGQKDAPLFVFIHGGYWQRGDKSIYSYLTAPFLDNGVDVAMIGYELCPATDMDTMVSKMRKALTWLWHNAASHGANGQRINLSGHSAGGHLTAMMLATKFDQAGKDLPADLIKTGNPISGLYQLDPLRKTTIGKALRLDDEASKRNSPYFLKPATDAPVLVTLGDGETSEFHWQTDTFVERWRSHDEKIVHFAEPEVDHFGVVNRLADSGSEIFRKTLAWLR